MNSKLLILTPFRNEETSVVFYRNALRNLRYPSYLLEAFWLENDSTDRTYEMLCSKQSSMPFRVTLETAEFLGPLKKQEPGNYFKDLPYKRFVEAGGTKKNTITDVWMVMFNEYLLPFARESDADYILFWFADAVPPKNVVSEYLKVFREKPDAGWVGSAIYRRFPRHNELAIIPFELAYSKEIAEAYYSAHCWMISRTALEGVKLSDDGWGIDVVVSLIQSLWDRGMKVYYQPSVFLKHVSTDGRIYNHEINLETAKPAFKNEEEYVRKVHEYLKAKSTQH